MAALLILVGLIFGNAYQQQKKYDLCKEIKFKSEQCKFQKFTDGFKKEKK